MMRFCAGTVQKKLLAMPGDEPAAVLARQLEYMRMGSEWEYSNQICGDHGGLTEPARHRSQKSQSLPARYGNLLKPGPRPQIRAVG
jgi:hypothetical protein